MENKFFPKKQNGATLAPQSESTLTKEQYKKSFERAKQVGEKLAKNFYERPDKYLEGFRERLNSDYDFVNMEYPNKNS